MASSGFRTHADSRFHVVFEQAPFSTQLLSPEGRTLAVNRAWKELWGVPEEFVQSYILKDYNILEDQQLVAKGTMEYIRRGFAGEACELPPILYVPKETGTQGQPKWVSAFIYPLKDESGRITEVVLTHQDVTRTKVAEEELRRSRDQLQIIFDGVADGIIVQDPAYRCVYANEVGARMCGFPSAEEFRDASIPDLLKRFELRDEQGGPFPVERLPARRALSGEKHPPETIIRVRDMTSGADTWSIVTARPIFDSTGKPTLAVSIFRDITQQRLRDERQTFLNEATQVLSSSLDYNETLKKIAELAVPRLADWCAIDLIEEDGPRSVVVAHHDPAKRDLAETLRLKYPPDWNAPQGPANVLKTGQSQFNPEISDELLILAARDEEHLRTIRGLGVKSAMIVPLKAHNQVLGCINFVSAESGVHYTKADLEIAEELAARAGLALENARLYRAAQDAVRARDEFISICSHELRTPVTSMKLQFEMAAKRIERGDASVHDLPVVTKRVHNTNSQLDRMAHLIDEMLDVSRIAMGRLEMNIEAIDLREVVSEVAGRFEEQFSSQNITIDVLVPADPVRVRGDRFRLEQVLSNLLSNALKYGEGRPVKLSLAAREAMGRIEVRDQGIGIARENLERVFNRFERVASSRSISGLGLGLYISRQIVQAHQGRIWAESEPGSGTMFVSELPLATDERADHER